MAQCEVDGCTNPVTHIAFADLCDKHYHEFKEWQAQKIREVFER